MYRLKQIRSQLKQLEYTMLGLESHVQIEDQVSRLSISSNANRSKNSKTISIHNPSTMNSEAAANSNNTSNIKNQKIRQLRLKMQQIQKNQQDMENRMKMFVTLAEKEVKKKEDQNLQLQNILTSLKEELSQSRGDLEILSNYVSKKYANNLSDDKKSLRSSDFSSKNVLNGATINKQIEIKDHKKLLNQSPKPRLHIIDKSKNLSPTTREQKKGSFASTNISSPLKCKQKSPFK